MRPQIHNVLINLDGRYQTSTEESSNRQYLFEEGQAFLSVKGEAAVFCGGLRMGNSIC